MKKLICICMAALMMCSLTACAGNLNHYTKKESEALMEDVIGQDVTYVSTDKYPKEKKVVHLFEDKDGVEFAVISEMSQGWFSVGLYRCYISDNYIAAKLEAHEQEIMDILEQYELKQYLTDLDYVLDEDIALGEGACPDVFYFELPIGSVEENKEVIEHVAAAGAQIDELLSLCYDEGYALDVDLEGGDYQNYVGYTGMNLRFMYEGIAYDGRVYEKSDMMSFNWSLTEDKRWGEEALYDYLEAQLSEAVGREPEE